MVLLEHLPAGIVLPGQHQVLIQKLGLHRRGKRQSQQTSKKHLHVFANLYSETNESPRLPSLPAKHALMIGLRPMGTPAHPDHANLNHSGNEKTIILIHETPAFGLF
jgi:hypothetical protein